MFAWKRISDGEIAQGKKHRADTAEDLFEQAGFGAVNVDEPLKGWLAVKVELVDGVLVEVTDDISPKSRNPSV
jgi:hypothetical protein